MQDTSLPLSLSTFLTSLSRSLLPQTYPRSLPLNPAPLLLPCADLSLVLQPLLSRGTAHTHMVSDVAASQIQPTQARATVSYRLRSRVRHSQVLPSRGASEGESGGACLRWEATTQARRERVEARDRQQKHIVSCRPRACSHAWRAQETFAWRHGLVIERERAVVERAIHHDPSSAPPRHSCLSSHRTPVRVCLGCPARVRGPACGDCMREQEPGRGKGTSAQSSSASPGRRRTTSMMPLSVTPGHPSTISLPRSRDPIGQEGSEAEGW